MPGFVASVWAHPEDGTGALVLSNTTGGPAPGALGADLVRHPGQARAAIPAEWAPNTEADPALVELSGPWYWVPAPFVLRLCAARWLELGPMAGGGRRSRFRPDSADPWIGAPYDPSVPIPGGADPGRCRPGRLAGVAPAGMMAG